MRTEKMIEYFREKGFDVECRIIHMPGYTSPWLRRASQRMKRSFLYAEGIARRSHTQEPDGTIGRDLSTNRAISSLFKKFHRKKKVVHSWFMA
jgi:hypothetical protein